MTYKLVVTVSAEISWSEPPKDTAQEIIRRQENLRVQRLADLLTPEIKHMLLDKIELARS